MTSTQIHGLFRTRSGREPAASTVVVKNVRMRSGLLVLLWALSAHAQDPVRDLLPEGDDSDPIGTGDTATLRDVPEPSNEPAPDPTLGPGLYHFNEQPNAYWIDKIKQKGFVYEQYATETARDHLRNPAPAVRRGSR